MERELVVKKVLELVSCAEDYGFNKSILISGLAELIETLSDKEIEKHCSWFLSEEAKEQNYSIEDYETIKERLIEFKNDYII